MWTNTAALTPRNSEKERRTLKILPTLSQHEVMSPGLLLLLLMSSCLLSGAEKTKKQKFVAFLKENYHTFLEILTSGAEMIPGAGSVIAGGLKIGKTIGPQEQDPLGPVKSGLTELQVQLDNLHAEMTWDAWAASAYLVPVNDIEKAWDKYTQNPNDKESFNTYYSQFADSTSVLHRYLTAKPDSATPNLGDVLAAKLKCHEDDVKAQFLYFNKIMYRGKILDEIYQKGTNTKATVAANELASQSASALFDSYKRCFSDIDSYIERDVVEHTDDSKEHEEIANDVRAFLEKKYDRYEWMVVAYSTKNDYILRWIKRHVLSGFTKVVRGTVTVAVAKQVKGGATMAGEVRKVIDKCLSQSGMPFCFKMIDKIQKCQEKVAGKKTVFQTITAIHTYKAKSKTSTTAVKVTEGEESELPDSSYSFKGGHLHTGMCQGAVGNFIILIKSDEEITGVGPCSKVKCGQKGKCVVLPRSSIGLCECQYPFHGDSCEKSLETFSGPDIPPRRKSLPKIQSPNPAGKTKG